jgi:hypothetical protein
MADSMAGSEIKRRGEPDLLSCRAPEAVSSLMA